MRGSGTVGSGAVAYYNENDPFAAAWLRGLIDAGLVAFGVVDTRDIRDVRAEDLEGFTQHHFFAGIGGWSLALRLAGWVDDREVWTGSCPCQPFSAAGRQQGVKDARHLWPEWFRLIREHRPPVLFGEQVASKAALEGWFDPVADDLEGEGYAVGAADLGAASVGAPHIRQRLWFVADAVSAGWPEGGTSAGNGQAASGSGLVGDSSEPGLEGRSLPKRGGGGQRAAWQAGGDASGMADDNGQGRSGQRRIVSQNTHASPGADSNGGGTPWLDALWLPCRDGKARPIPVEPALFPLAHAGTIRNRVGTLRGSGNAIVPAVAAQFIEAYLDVTR